MHKPGSALISAARALACDPQDPRLRAVFLAEVTSCIVQPISSYSRRRLAWYGQAEFEDVLQETLYEVFKKAVRLCVSRRIDTERTPQEVAAYLREIARGELLDQAKRHLRKLTLRTSVDPDERPSPVLPPVEQLIRGELDARVRSAVDKLRPDDKRIVELYFREEHSHQQIATELRISRSASRTRLHRAVSRLKAILCC